MEEKTGGHAFDDLTCFTLSKAHIATLGERFCREKQVVLLGEVHGATSGATPLGMLRVSDDATVAEVEEAVGRPVRRIQLNAYELDTALTFGYGPDSAEEGSITLDIGTGRLVLDHEREIEFDRERTPAEMVADLVSTAVRRGASDIHIETYATDVDARLRIDGVLQQLPTPLSHGNVRRVCSYLKILAELDISEHRRDQDGRISTVYRDAEGNARRIDLRVSILPGPNGPDAVLRVLDEGRIGLGLGELGMDAAVHDRLGRLIRHPGGLLIVAGPTACGKTTTLYAALKEINTDGNKILTVEDPIEYEIPKINQKQVSAQMSFANYSRAFMRQNPDVLMIGEVRDEETAEAALRAAQMGHLVLTTLHARDVPSALNRLLVLCGDRTRVASGLLGILSQRLVRRVCDACRRSWSPDAGLLNRLPQLPAGIEHVRGAGCEACAGTGYHGQTGVFELLAFDDELRDRVWHGEQLELDALPGFRTMLADAVEKVRAGVTTMEEVVRNLPLAV